MERIAPAGDVYQAGTLSGTRSPSRPGSRRSRCSTRPPTPALAALTERLAAGLREAAGERGRGRSGPVRARAADPFFTAAPVC
jgi:glutamate-1-semialdehyde 2,1-aminomutase